MIKSVGTGTSAAIEAAKLRESAKAAAPAKASADPARSSVANTASPAARMAAQGAPIDNARIERVKAAIASGNYPVDPEGIAEKMLDLDLPPAKH
jgi:negative regulator of flagellin synthesis FlgM